MSNFVQKFQTDKAIGERAIAFNPLLPEKIKVQEFKNGCVPAGFEVIVDDRHNSTYINYPSGAEILDNGDIKLRMYAKNATSVTVNVGTDNMRQKVELSDIGNGMFEGILTYNPELVGPKSVDFFVDGMLVINPYCPIWFHRNRPSNYIEIPDEGTVNFIGLNDNVEHGSVVNNVFYSKAIDDYLRCTVYTPPGYMNNSEEYPVLYLQHGSTENEATWVYNGKLAYIMDNLIAEGKCVPFIVVTNDGMVRLDDPEDLFHPVEEIITEDCREYIESHYRVKKDKWNRAVAGLSMGSRQAAYIGLVHPELYSYVGIFSSSAFQSIDLSSVPIFDDEERFNQEYKVFWRSIGDYDTRFAEFVKDDKLLEEHGVDTRPAYVRKVYPKSMHEWGCWRYSIHDFAQLLFQN